MKRLLVVLALFLFGCGGPTADDIPQTLRAKTIVLEDCCRLVRYIDTEASMVCWVYEDRGGISCVPLAQTGLQP